MSKVKFDEYPNYKLFQKALKNIKSNEIDTNIFMDGNHVKRAIDNLIEEAQTVHELMFEHYKLGQCPRLAVNEHVYSEIIHYIIRKVEYSLFWAYEKYSKSKLGKSIIRENEAFSAAHTEKRVTGKIFSDEEDLFEKSVTGLKEGWDKKRPEILKFYNYVNFFIGGEYNAEKLVYDLKSKLQDTQDQYTKTRLEEFLKSFSGKSHNSFEAKKRQLLNAQFNTYKLALADFDKKWPNIVSETHKGYLRHQIHERSKVLVEFHEKAVDTKLIIKALDDLSASNDSTIFAIFTNDTDFAPLFEKIMSKRQLIWIYGGDSKKGSSELKKIVEKANSFNISELVFGVDFKKYGHQNYLSTQWWKDNQLAPIIKGGASQLWAIYFNFFELLHERHSENAYYAYMEENYPFQ